MSDHIENVSVVVADDEATIRQTVSHHLKKMGCSVRSFERGDECIDAFKEEPADILVVDLRMPGADGIEVLRRAKEVAPDTEVIIVTAHGDKEVAIDALRLGAFDFFEKPISLAQLGETIKRTVRYQSALRERDRLKKQLSALSEQEARAWGITAMVGNTDAMKKVLRDIRLLQKAKNTSVLVMGESGTGKELVARGIHFGSPRASDRFVPINCSAVPEDLAESILFGHVKGSFTGANADRTGCFEQANGGTLFMDEIGDMSGTLQTKLLRVLEDGIVTPVGASTGVKVDVRIIAATNRNLEERVSGGSFRSDLYYRLAGYTVIVPPLRDRKGDIPLLAEHFLGKLADDMGVPKPAIWTDAMAALKAYDFPGNVRQLRNIVERALIESCGEGIKAAHLQLGRGLTHGGETEPAACTAGDTDALPMNLKEAEKVLIRRAMESTDGNVSAAARLLGIGRTRLYRQLDSM